MTGGKWAVRRGEAGTSRSLNTSEVMADNVFVTDGAAGTGKSSNTREEGDLGLRNRCWSSRGNHPLPEAADLAVQV